MRRSFQPFSYLPLALPLLLAAACDAADPSGPAPAPAAAALPSAGNSGVVVMTRNLYLGGDLERILSVADPNQAPFVAAQVWAEIMASDFPARAGKLADEIAATRPDLIGLQEATTWRRQTPSDFVLGNFAPNATAVVWNFTDILLDALRARGLDYRVAARVVNQDVELPMYTGTGPLPFDDVRYTDEDVILVKAGVAYEPVAARNYAAFLPLTIGGLPVSLKRGFVAIDAEVNRRAFRFVNTHLETQSFKPIQEAQTAELIAWLQASPRPVILVGDINSAANPSAPASRKTASYGMLLGAGYTDIWTRGNDEDSGLTCCHAKDLRNAAPTFDQRIDVILVNQGFDGLVGAAQAEVVGADPAGRTASGLWPSDHAGIAAVLRLPIGSRLASR